MMNEKMRVYSYVRPTNLENCLLELSKGGIPIAGGTDLMILIRDGIISPNRLVDISKIKELKGIYEEDDKIRLGALTTFSDLVESKLVRENIPVLYDSAISMGSPLIRNVATIGGNICNASPACDSAPPLIVLGANAKIVGNNGDRKIAVEDIFKSVRKTSLSKDEILYSIEIKKNESLGASFLKLGKRNALAISVISVATSLVIKNGVIEDCRIALGAVAPVPMRAKKAEEYLKGKEVKNAEKIFSETSKIAMEESCPITDVRACDEYRKKMVEVYTKRSLFNSLNRSGVRT
ncbi:MAG: FAD binding domain-containing protein [Thermoplasmata archaeon]